MLTSTEKRHLDSVLRLIHHGGKSLRDAVRHELWHVAGDKPFWRARLTKLAKGRLGGLERKALTEPATKTGDFSKRYFLAARAFQRKILKDVPLSDQ